jgi:predicted RND superfamily exporter protein
VCPKFGELSPFANAISLVALPLINKSSTYYKLVLLAVLVITAFFTTRLPTLRFDYDFEAFFPNEDSELELYSNYRETFEYDNEFVLIAPENHAGIFRPGFFIKVDSLTRLLQNLPFVRSVQSPTTMKRISFDGLVPVTYPLLHVTDTVLYARDSAYVYSDGSLVGSFFPRNGRSLAIFVKTETGLSKKKSDQLAASIEATINRFSFDDVHVAGRIFAQQIYIEKLQYEFVLFIAISFALILLFLWFTFRNFYALLIPVLVVVISILWTLGLMSILNKPIDIMTTMLPTMVFIAGMSDVVHFFSKYFDSVSEGVPREKIYALILKEVGFPTFLTLITTVVGFLSLLFSSIKPVRDFGIYTSVGITIAFILTYSLMPAVLFFVRPSKIALRGQHQKANGLLRRTMFFIFRRQKSILLVTALLLVLAVFGISRIRINNLLLEDLNDTVRIKQDFIFFDKYYSGARPFELQISTKKGSSLWQYDHMLALHRVDSFIRTTYDPGFLVSPPLLVREYYKAKAGDVRGSFPSRQDYEALLPSLKKRSKHRDIRNFMLPDGSLGRISGKIRDIGSARVSELNRELFEFIRHNADSTRLEFSLTGAAHLIDRNNEYMVNNMLQGFVFSVGLIGLLTFLLHRSWRMVLVFILPNVIPLLIIAGIMGYAGIELKAATSIVFSIAFGIATDDTIHFISRLKIEQRYGKSLLYAFKRTYFETGRPIALTTFILLGGFMSLMGSSFQSTFYFGFLICITIIVALLADLFLLPVLLFLFYRKS